MEPSSNKKRRLSPQDSFVSLTNEKKNSYFSYHPLQKWSLISFLKRKKLRNVSLQIDWKDEYAEYTAHINALYDRAERERLLAQLEEGDLTEHVFFLFFKLVC
jgi:hypothetical protein